MGAAGESSSMVFHGIRVVLVTDRPGFGDCQP